MIQGLHAQHNRLADRHLQPRYTKKEFDKWFQGYDALVEVPSYFDTDCLEAYAEDPDVKFILTERTPQSWAKSVNSFVGTMVTAIERPPLNVLRYFSKTLEYFCVANVEVYNLLSDGKRPGEVGDEAALMKNYQRYIRNVKRVIPAERMLIVKIEDGLGWEQICLFLGKDIPKGVEYPRGVEHEELKEQVHGTDGESCDDQIRPDIDGSGCVGGCGVVEVVSLNVQQIGRKCRG